MTRVLRILNRINLGGPVHNVAYLTKFLPPEYESRLLVGVKEDDEEDGSFIARRLGLEHTEIPELRRSINFSRDRAAYQHIKRIIREFKPDIVHTHAAKSGTIGRLAAFSCKVPVVVHTFHGHVFHSYFGKAKTRLYLNIERYLARRSSGIVAISDIQKEELGNVFRVCPPDKIEVIPLGFDLDRFATNEAEKRTAFRQRFDIAGDEIAIGIIGRIAPVKNHSLFIAAAAKALAGTSAKLRFVIVGDGDARASVEGELRAAGIDYAYYPEAPRHATAICISWQTEMDEVLAGLDIVALSSHNEGTPVSLIEAQAAGRPVVSTRVGGVADVVRENVTGFITPPGDADAFADALLRLINDEATRKAFAAAGRDAVAERFSYQRLVRDMDGYYRKLLAERR